MDYLRQIFNDANKKNLLNLGAIFIVGIVLLLYSGSLFKSKSLNEESEQSNETAQVAKETEKVSAYSTYEQQLENRLEETLKLVENVGNVKAMLTLSYGKEIILASNVVYDETLTTETDSEGGVRETSKSNGTDQKIIIKDTNNSDKPLIIKEIEPKVEGVIIIAQGGGDVMVKDALIRATQTVLGIEAHKVQVLKMK